MTDWNVAGGNKRSKRGKNGTINVFDEEISQALAQSLLEKKKREHSEQIQAAMEDDSARDMFFPSLSGEKISSNSVPGTPNTPVTAAPAQSPWGRTNDLRKNLRRPPRQAKFIPDGTPLVLGCHHLDWERHTILIGEVTIQCEDSNLSFPHLHIPSFEDLSNLRVRSSVEKPIEDNAGDGEGSKGNEGDHIQSPVIVCLESERLEQRMAAVLASVPSRPEQGPAESKLKEFQTRVSSPAATPLSPSVAEAANSDSTPGHTTESPLPPSAVGFGTGEGTDMLRQVDMPQGVSPMYMQWHQQQYYLQQVYYQEQQYRMANSAGEQAGYPPPGGMAVPPAYGMMHPAMYTYHHAYHYNPHQAMYPQGQNYAPMGYGPSQLTGAEQMQSGETETGST